MWASSLMMAAALILVSGSLGYMASQRRIPIEVLSMEPVNLTVAPGQMLEINYKFIQHERCHIHSDRTIYDSRGVRYVLQPIEFRAGVGENDVEQNVIVRIPIPTDIATGPARFENSTVYRCNIVHWLWPIMSLYNPIHFEVRAP